MKVLKIKRSFKETYFKKAVVIDIDNDIYFITNGMLHSKKYPTSYEFCNGARYWYLNNQQHRSDGPAVYYGSNYTSWWYKGRCYGDNTFTKSSWKRFM